MTAAALLLAGCADKMTKAYQEADVARTLLQSGDLPGAKAAISRALALRGDQAALLLLDGRINYMMKDFVGAFDSYSMALAIDPNNPEALQAVSQIGASIGRDDDSTAATEKILALDPKNMPALLVTGVRQLTRKNYSGAEATGDRMLSFDANSEPGLVLKARAKFMAGQQAEALTLLRDGVKRLGPKQMLVTALLESAREQGDAEVMLDQFRVLSDIVPRNVDLTIDEANVQYKRGLMAEARSRGWALLTENGGNEEAVARLVALWNEYDKTPLTPDQIAKLAQDGAPVARLAAARFYLMTGDARTAGTLIGALEGGDAAGLKARIAYITSGGTDTAPAEQVLASDAKNCDALAVHSTVAARSGKSADAVEAAQVIASECPSRDGFDLLAQAYRAKGDDAGQRRAMLDGIRAQPMATAPTALYAAYLIGAGDPIQATAVARRLTQRAPAKLSGWRLLRGVCSRARQPACVAEANQGEAKAKVNYAIDLPPGERRPNPLLGSSWR